MVKRWNSPYENDYINSIESVAKVVNASFPQRKCSIMPYSESSCIVKFKSLHLVATTSLQLLDVEGEQSHKTRWSHNRGSHNIGTTAPTSGRLNKFWNVYQTLHIF